MSSYIYNYLYIFISSFLLSPLLSPLLHNNNNNLSTKTTSTTTSCCHNLFVEASADFVEQFDLYEVLEVQRDSPMPEIRKSYRRLSLLWHPDKQNKNSSTFERSEADEKFRTVTRAYEVLSDVKDRKYYDHYGEHYEDMREYFEEIINKFDIPELYLLKKGMTILFEKNVQKILNKSRYTWVVTFFHANCGSCRGAVPVILQLGALASKTKTVRVGGVNCAVNMSLCRRFGIASMGQTIVIPAEQDEDEGPGMWYSVIYKGPFNAQAMLKFAQNVKGVYMQKYNSEMDLINHITVQHPTVSWKVSMFAPIEAIWLVSFTSRNCQSCKQLQRDLRNMSNDVKDVMQVVVVDCSGRNCNVPYVPFLRLLIKRQGQITPDTVDLASEDNNIHSDAIAARAVGLALKHIIGFSWKKAKEDKQTFITDDEL
eukprot:GHVS01015818.1.p1 GENE.GHVS01015818.1~~GHVS01015818.1.p1  ORF type:complete len:426 (+),score=54.17 GHVS01015818.1:74-1351(+)